MNLKEFLQTTPETLAEAQHAALKKHVVETLRNVADMVEKEMYAAISNNSKLLIYQGGDGEADDAYYINVGPDPQRPENLYDTLGRLNQLKNLAKTSARKEVK